MKRYGLIGFPLGHSFSRRYFTEKFKKENKAEEYLNFELVHIWSLPDLVRENPDLAGLNVTIPWKEAVMGYLDHIDGEALEIGAVNTIRLRRSGEQTFLEGFNTDGYGFSASIAPLLRPWDTQALVLGTGGASKAIIHVLRRMGIGCLGVSRTPGEKKEGRVTGYDLLTREVMEQHTLIVNTTPLGTYPQIETYPPIPYQWVTPRHFLYDLVYNPEETSFLSKGRIKGALVKNGYEMLVLQAEKAYEIWNEEVIM